jgi:hypothetical protein
MNTTITDEVMDHISKHANVIMMSITCVLTTFLTNASSKIVNTATLLVTNVLGAFVSILSNAYASWKKRVNDVSNVVTISSHSVSEKGVVNATNSDNLTLITSVLAYVIDRNVYSSSMGVNLTVTSVGTTNDLEHHMRNTDFQYFYNGPVVFEEFTISYNISVDQLIKTTTTLSVSSQKSSADIRAFIEECYKTRVEKNIKKRNEQCFYEHIKHSTLCFYKYEFNSAKTFDDIFFDEKTIVQNLVTKLMRKELVKLTLLLHGEPGVGKTSIIKAIANETKYSVFRVKLNYIKSNSELMDLFHNASVYTTRKYDTVPTNKRIYVFEDIDADCDIVHTRLDAVKPVDDVMKPLLTLADVLNALDGIMEINGSIIVLTTNHVDKLDPALIRPGRITYNLKLRKMSSKSANDFCKAQFGKDASITLPDNVITPATFESLCCMSQSAQQLQQLVNAYSVEPLSSDI